MKRLVPNAITIGRILVTPLFLVALFKPTLGWQFTALVVFVIAAISDYVDGRLARSYQVRSRLGQFLDPLADKVLVLGAFIAFVILRPEQVPWWAVGLIAARDLAVTLLRSWAEANGHTIHTLSAAKAKTAFQLTYLIAMLLFFVLEQLPGGSIQGAAEWVLASWIPYAFLLLVTAVTVYTGILYFTRLEYVSPTQLDG